MMRTVCRHPRASVAVKDGEPGDIVLLVGDPDHCGVGVLHLDPPALHGGQPVPEPASHLGLIVFFSFRFVKKCTHFVRKEYSCFLRFCNKYGN